MEPKRKILGENAGGQAKEKDRDKLGEELNTPVSDPENEAAKAKADDAHREGAIRGGRPGRFKMLLLVGCASLCLLLVAGLLLIRFTTALTLFSKPVQKLEPVTSIMRPIPVPDYREMLDFLLVYDVESQKMVTAIRMEIGYQSATRYQNFKEQYVTFRGTVYAFLHKQNLPGNSVKTWHSVLEKDLPDYLKLKLPKSYPDKILLTQVENF